MVNKDTTVSQILDTLIREVERRVYAEIQLQRVKRDETLDDMATYGIGIRNINPNDFLRKAAKDRDQDG